jgi:hypothetical protein
VWSFWRSKTVWTAIIAAVAGIGFYATGEIAFADLFRTLSICALAAFLRHGISKAEL